MKRALVAVLIGTALLASPMAHSGAAGQAQCISRAAVPVPPAYASTVARARALVCDKLAGRISGLQVAVGVDGKLVWSEGFGYADVARKIPVTAETQFRIGSVSKPMTAAAVALLYEQGKLDLDAPVQRYVPSFPDKGVPITTRQLAGHLAGIRHYRGDEFLLNRRFTSVLEGLTIFQGDSLLFPPGTKFSYSTYGWNLISAVVEAAAGQDFLSYMGRNVFRPLGMTHTAADRVDSLIPNRTRFYERAGCRRDHVESVDRAARAGRGDPGAVRPLTRSAPRLLPLARIEQGVGERGVGLDLGVLLEPALVPIHQKRHLRREPGTPGWLILVEADVVGAGGVPLTRLEQPHEHQALAIHPELPRPQIARLGADDVDGTPFPRVLVHGREVDLEPLDPRDGPLHRVEVDVEAQHHERMDERRHVPDRVGGEDELGVVHEQDAVPGIG